MRESTSTLDEATSAAVAIIRAMDALVPEFFDYMSDREYEQLELGLVRALRRVLDGERHNVLGMPAAAVGLDKRSREFQGTIDAALPADGYYRLHARIS